MIKKKVLKDELKRTVKRLLPNAIDELKVLSTGYRYDVFEQKLAEVNELWQQKRILEWILESDSKCKD